MTLAPPPLTPWSPVLRRLYFSGRSTRFHTPGFWVNGSNVTLVILPDTSTGPEGPVLLFGSLMGAVIVGAGRASLQVARPACLCPLRPRRLPV